MVYSVQVSCGAVAQLARVLDWQSRGREFESLQLHHKNLEFIGVFFFYPAACMPCIIGFD